MLILIATVSILAAQDDAKTMSMIRLADHQIRSGYQREGFKTLFEAALRVDDPTKGVGSDSGKWDQLIDRFTNSAPVTEEDPFGCYLAPISEYRNGMLAMLGRPKKKYNLDDIDMGSIAWLQKVNGSWRIEILSTWGSRWPDIVGPAYRIGDRIVAGGPASFGGRNYVALRSWRQTSDGWKELPVLKDQRLDAGSHYLNRGSRIEPNVLVAQMREYSDLPIYDYGYVSAPDRVFEEQWRYDGNRYVRRKGHYLQTAFLSLERFLLAMQRNDFRAASHYASAGQISLMRKVGACSSHWPKTIIAPDDATEFNLQSQIDGSVPVCRVTMKRAGDHWRISRIDPHAKAAHAAQG